MLENFLTHIDPSVIYSSAVVIIVYAFRESAIQYITELMSDYKIYSNRRVDDDGDPLSGQFCTVESRTNDGIHHIYYVEHYLWGRIKWIVPSNRRVKVWKYLKRKKKWVATKLPFSVWGSYTVYEMPIEYNTMSLKLEDYLNSVIAKVQDEKIC